MQVSVVVVCILSVAIFYGEAKASPFFDKIMPAMADAASQFQNMFSGGDWQDQFKNAVQQGMDKFKEGQDQAQQMVQEGMKQFEEMKKAGEKPEVLKEFAEKIMQQMQQAQG